MHCTHSAQIYRKSNFACPNRNCNFFVMQQPFQGLVAMHLCAKLFAYLGRIVHCTSFCAIYRKSIQQQSIFKLQCFMQQPFARTYSNVFICKAFCTFEQNSALHFILRNIERAFSSSLFKLQYFMQQPFSRNYSNAFICKAFCIFGQNSALHFILRNI